MSGQHPFDFLDQAPNRLPEGMQPRAAANIAALVAHIERQGLRVSVEQTLYRAAELWRSDPRNPPLSVLADPDLQAPLPPGSTITVMLYRDGVPVGCAVQRHIWTWNLVRDMEHLNYWFPDLEEKPAGFTCTARPAWLKSIVECWTVYSCCLYLRKEAQPHSMQSALSRLAHGLSAARWRWSWLFGRARCAVAAKLPFRVYGVDNVSTGVFLLGPGTDPVEGHPHFLAAISRPTIEAQLSHPLYGVPSEAIDIPPDLRAPVASPAGLLPALEEEGAA